MIRARVSIYSVVDCLVWNGISADNFAVSNYGSAVTVTSHGGWSLVAGIARALQNLDDADLQVLANGLIVLTPSTPANR